MPLGPKQNGQTPALLAGELHLHQFPLGSHAWAQFVQPYLPTSMLHFDALVHLDYTPVSVEGPCALYVTPSCQPACDAGSYCAQSDRCAPLPKIESINGGDLAVRGSLRQDLIRIFWGPDGYDSEPPAGNATLFAGGENLHVSGGGVWALDGLVPAPWPVVFLTPDPMSPLRLPKEGPWTIRWVPEGGEAMVLRLTAATQEGLSSYLRCVLSDSGAFDIPPRLLAGLPPPPRQIRLELDRSAGRIFPTSQTDIGFAVHAEFTAWRVGTE